MTCKLDMLCVAAWPQLPPHHTSPAMNTRLTASAIAALLLVVAAHAGAQEAKSGDQPKAPAANGAAPAKPGEGAKGGAGGPPGGARSAPPAAVSVFTVKLTDINQNLSATGSAAPVQSVGVRSQITALLANVHAREGQMVKKGQLLFELDSRSERANLAKAQANLARSQSNLQELERQLTRSRSLQDQSFVSASATDNIGAQVAAQKQQVSADRAALQAQELQVSLYNIYAPIAGRVGRIDVVAGSLVASGVSAAPLLTITQMDPMGVDFSLPQTNVATIRAAGVGATVRISPSTLNAAPPSNGKLSFIDSSINASTGMLALRAQVPNPKQDLWPGTAVRIELQARSLPQVAVVPQAAVMLKNDKRFVYVVGEDKKAKPQNVDILAVIGERVAVKGLSAGQNIVVDGRQNVRPGATVRVIGPALLSGAHE